MRATFVLLPAVATLAAGIAIAQTAPPPASKIVYVDLGNAANGIMYEPATPGAKARIALIATNIGTNNLRQVPGPLLSQRGYRVLLLNHYGDWIGYEEMVPALAAAVKHLRGVAGVEKVLLLGHSGGGPLMTFYQNLATNGPKVCQGPEKLYPCRGSLSNMPKADGLILLDSHIGTGFEQLTYTDPANSSAMRPTARDAALDMFDPRNGFVAGGPASKYSPEFKRKFFAAQGERNRSVIEYATERLALIEKGKGDYKDDEPFVVPASGARLLQPDPSILSRTHDPHPLLHPDGTVSTQIVPSVRPAVRQERSVTGSLAQSTKVTTVRRFLAGFALRTTPDYNMTEDSITGIDWASSSTSAMSNIQGVTAPTVIVAMTCHYFLVPDEIIYNNSPAKDKQYVLLEGASHVFTPCRPEFGDTSKRLFDFLDDWISHPGRFVAATAGEQSK
jgi:pimeloyl-ACP methyl ester carboxylesterase